MKHPRNINPSSKCSTNQGKITFKPYISKPYLLSFLHSMYNFIKLNNHSSLNFKKRRENTNKLPHTPTKNTSTSSKTRISPSNPVSVNFNPTWWRELPSNRKRTKNFTSTTSYFISHIIQNQTIKSHQILEIQSNPNLSKNHIKYVSKRFSIKYIIKINKKIN